MKTPKAINTEELLRHARNLKSEHGENAEYDRALVELTTFALSLTADDFDRVHALLGIRRHTRVCNEANDRSATEICICRGAK